MTDTTATAFYRYPPRQLVGDYLRAAAGTAFGLLILFSTDPSTCIVVVFGTLTGIFLLFGLRTLRQHLTRVAVNDDGVFTKDLTTRALPWTTLRQIKLRYFGTRRQHKHTPGGFMELTLRGDGVPLKFESSLDGFRDVAWHAARAARRNGVTLDPTTAGNLLGIGIDADKETPRPQAGEERVEL